MKSISDPVSLATVVGTAGVHPFIMLFKNLQFSDPSLPAVADDTLACFYVLEEEIAIVTKCDNRYTTSRMCVKKRENKIGKITTNEHDDSSSNIHTNYSATYLASCSCALFSTANSIHK
jgi:hypothetical protein